MVLQLSGSESGRRATRLHPDAASSSWMQALTGPGAQPLEATLLARARGK